MLVPRLIFIITTYFMAHAPCNQQCFGSGLDPDSFRSADPDPDPGGQKWPIVLEKIKKFIIRNRMQAGKNDLQKKKSEEI